MATDILTRKQFIIANQPHIVTPPAASIQNFETDLIAPFKECKVHFLPKQEGSGDPSPQNERPLSGWIELFLFHSGENLYTPNPNNAGYISKSGVINVDTTSTYTDLIPVNAGDVVLFRCTTVIVNGDTNRRVHGYNSSGTWVQQLTSGTTAPNTVEDRKILTTIPNGISYIRVSFRNQDTNVRIAKENAIEVNWAVKAGTVYGGYIDLLTGEVWGTYHKITLDGENVKVNRPYSANGNYGAGWVYTNPSGKSARYRNGVPTNIWCENMPLYIGVTAVPEPPYVYAPLAGALYLVVYLVKAEDHPELDDNTARINYVNEWLKENPITVAYELETPVLLATLTLAQIKTLRGANYLWSNANGNIDIKYWKH